MSTPKAPTYSRREFFVQSSVTLLLVPLAAACSSSSSSGTMGTPSNVTGCAGTAATSSASGGHTHTLCVPSTDLTAPPSAGVVYETSLASNHQHAVSLSQTQLQSIEAGDTVRVTTTSVEGHTHDFSIVRAASAPPEPTGGGMGY